MKRVIGDYRAFFSLQLGRLKDIRIDISGCELSHLAYRTETYDEYLQTRERIEKHCTSNIEKVWNGRPISIMQLKEPLTLGEGFEVGMIELIPPVHRRVYKMGLEHVGVVIGDSVDEFSHKHRTELTGQQFQSELCQPYYVTFFEDFTMASFIESHCLKSVRGSAGDDMRVFLMWTIGIQVASDRLLHALSRSVKFF
jgi:predicted metalloenzyme YecM